MNIADIRAAVKKNCGRDYADFNNFIDSWVNNTVREALMMKYNLWFMEHSETIPTVAAQRAYSLPDNYKEELDGGVLYRMSNGVTTPLDIMNEAEVRKYWTETDTGQPQAIVIKEDTYEIWPLPDAAYDIDWNCFVFMSDLSDANTSNYLSTHWPNVYINAGTFKGFQFLEEYERAAYWEGEMTKIINDIVSYNLTRQTGNLSLGFSANVGNYKLERGYIR